MTTMTTNLIEPTRIHLLRYAKLMEKVLRRHCFNDVELKEYHALSNIWTALYNARKQGVILSDNQRKFMDLKRVEMFRKNAQTSSRIRQAWGGFRTKQNLPIVR